METTSRTRPRIERARQPLDVEEVRRRNSVERIKHEKAPLALLDELPRLAATPYEAVDEADVLRLQWLGLYHDKPKVGGFMLRVKIPGGILSPAQLETVAQISIRHGRNTGELTTRQSIQIHEVRLASVPAVLEALAAVGLTSLGACGDVLRNVTACPVAGIDPRELLDPTPLVAELSRRFGSPEWFDLPRKHKWTVSTCPFHCNAPSIHDVALVATTSGGEPGYAVAVGGGLSTVPRLARPLGVFLRPDEAPEVLGAILATWSEDLESRRSRAKARFKFLVDDVGVEAVRERVEARLGRRLTDLAAFPRPAGRTSHLGVHPEKEPGRVYAGFPVLGGVLPGEALRAVARAAARHGRDVRLSREQNLVVTGVREATLGAFLDEMAAVGLSVDAHPLVGTSIGCTGNPYCNFAVGETKPRLVRLVRHLERRFGAAVLDLSIHLDGCPHACGQHWVGDLGIQGTTLKTEAGKVEAYDVLAGGGVAPVPAIGRLVARRVPSADLDAVVERFVATWLERREPGETLASYVQRLGDEAFPTPPEDRT